MADWGGGIPLPSGDLEEEVEAEAALAVLPLSQNQKEVGIVSEGLEANLEVGVSGVAVEEFSLDHLSHKRANEFANAQIFIELTKYISFSKVQFRRKNSSQPRIE